MELEKQRLYEYIYIRVSSQLQFETQIKKLDGKCVQICIIYAC